MSTIGKVSSRHPAAHTDSDTTESQTDSGENLGNPQLQALMDGLVNLVVQFRGVRGPTEHGALELCSPGDQS